MGLGLVDWAEIFDRNARVEIGLGHVGTEGRIGFKAILPQIAAGRRAVGPAIDRHAFGRAVHEDGDIVHRAQGVDLPKHPPGVGIGADINTAVGFQRTGNRAPGIRAGLVIGQRAALPAAADVMTVVIQRDALVGVQIRQDLVHACRIPDAGGPPGAEAPKVRIV